MFIYTVVFSSIDTGMTPSVLPFSSLNAATNYALKDAEKRGIRIASLHASDGFLEDNINDGEAVDYRCEDDEGNSFYYTIWVQKLRGMPRLEVK